MENPGIVGEPEENRDIPETAELVSFSWYQCAMTSYESFFFRIYAVGQDDPVLYCEYMDEETGESIKIGGLEYETHLPVSTERRAELSDFLRKAELPVYRDPNPELLDTTVSHVSATWRENGEQFTNNYDGIYAHDLLELVKGIARETHTRMMESTAKTEEKLQ